MSMRFSGRKDMMVDDGNVPSTSNVATNPACFPSQAPPTSGVNIFRLLAKREISPRTKNSSKKLWGAASNCELDRFGSNCEATDAKQGLISWVEGESLRHLSAKYCPLVPPPRSTIAAAFSPDGKTLASTHGDHTVKIIDCQTGNCLKVLSGHRRTPWVVRFHPVHPEILASGSLDHEVRLWDANTADCIGSRDFYRPIASIAFHAQGELLAVASGHKLYIWHYNRRGEASSPSIVLKTRRSLRAVHFHPHAAPFLLTAEVNDLDSPDSPMSLATSKGYVYYPPPAIFFASVHSGIRSNSEVKLPQMPFPYMFLPTFAREEGRTSLQHSSRGLGSSSAPHVTEASGSMQPQTDSDIGSQPGYVVSPMEISPVVPSSSYPMQEDTVDNCFSSGAENAVPDSAVDAMETTEVQPISGGDQSRSPSSETSDGVNTTPPAFQSSGLGQAPNRPSRPRVEASPDTSATLSMATGIGQSRTAGRSGLRHRSSRTRSMAMAGSGETAGFINIVNDESDPQPVIRRSESELAPSLAAAAAAELPCTVKLRIWPHDIKDPCALLDGDKCRLTVPHAVLCSEMGAHFSPCGRFLAACVACMLPHMEADSYLQSQLHHDTTGAATSPTRHPVSAHQVMYELRIYSLEEATFGQVLASRAIRAAHCLTSIQFSPTSEHILLAYGRRHSSLLRSIVIDGETTIPIYTILEVYRVSDMELVRVLPSAEDEVNVACFHPLVGGGLVYGTKEGKLRILQYDSSFGINSLGPHFILEENMLEVPTYALEG